MAGGAASVDPVVQWVARSALGALFLWAAGHKLRDFGAFRQAFEGYRLLPPSLSGVAGALLIVGELALGIGLLVSEPRIPGMGAALLLSLYTVAIAINLLRGRWEIECGCGGRGASRPLGPALLVRNAVLIAVAMVCVPPPTGRALLWLDGVSVAGGLAVAVLLYAAAEATIGNAGRDLDAARAGLRPDSVGGRP